MFKFGELVDIKGGGEFAETGMIYKVPSKFSSKENYIVLTESAPYGEMLSGDELRLSETQDDHELRKELSRRHYLYSEYFNYIPEDADPSRYFREMAEIAPNYNKSHNIKNGFRVWVEGDEGLIPHCHVIFPKRQVAYIKLGSAEYLNGHYRKSYKPSITECKALQKFFESKIPIIGDNGKESEIMIWLFAVNYWYSCIIGDKTKERAFDNAIPKDESGRFIMPDYSGGISKPK